MTHQDQPALAGIYPTPPRPAEADEGTNCICTFQDEVKTPDPSYTTDTQSLSSEEILSRFESALIVFNPAAARSYAKAAASLRNFISAFQLAYEPLDTRMIADWLITLRIEGHSLSTIRLYLNAISSLYTRLGAEAADNAIDFRSLRIKLDEIEKTPVSDRRRTTTPPDETASALSGIPAGLLADLHRAAVIAGGLTLEAAARIRRADLPLYPEELQPIADRYADARRKYIFPLRQTAYTPRQLARALAKAIESSTDPKLRRLLPPSIEWLHTAMRCGATPSEAIAALGRDPLFTQPEGPITRLLQCAPAAPRDEEAACRLRRLVAGAVADDPLHWYAMRLRRKSDYAEITRRLADIAADPAEPIRLDATFYPMTEIARRTAKGIQHNQEPLLPDILFFRARLTQLQPLFRRIGDLAWCYKDASRRDRGYAPIPDAQMHAFQLAIGIFTPDTDIRPLGTLTPRPGQPVLVIGGPFAGRPGRFLATLPSSPAPSRAAADPATSRAAADPAPNTTALSPDATYPEPILYRLILPGDNGIEWEATIDPRLIALADTSATDLRY